MKCIICDADIPDDSKYCQKCGKKVNQKSISLDDLKEDVKDLINKSTYPRDKKYYDSILKYINATNFEKVKYEYGSEIPDCIKDFTDEEGNFVFKIPSDIDFTDISIEMISSLIENELESFHAELADISIGQHNDRVATLQTGIQLYEEKVQTEERRKDNLSKANESLRMGLNKLRQELQTETEVFKSIPKNPILKLFCGVSRKTANKKVCCAREGIVCYKIGMIYLIKTQLKLGQLDEAIKIIEEGTDFITKFMESKQGKRLIEYDDEEKELWEDNTIILRNNLLDVKDSLEKRIIILNIEGRDI